MLHKYARDMHVHVHVHVQRRNDSHFSTPRLPTTNSPSFVVVYGRRMVARKPRGADMGWRRFGVRRCRVSYHLSYLAARVG